MVRVHFVRGYLFTLRCVQMLKAADLVEETSECRPPFTFNKTFNRIRVSDTGGDSSAGR